MKNDKNEYSFFNLLNKASMDALGRLGLLNKSFTCTIKAHTEESLEDKTTPSITLKPSELYLCKFPLFEKKLGAYAAITKDIETRLNSDSSDISLAANLFVGCLICVENLVVCCVTIEVYNREFSNDVHAERFKISYPELIDRGDRYYEGIKTLVIEEKNGKQTMRKLIIGTTQFNLLVTCTVLLSDTSDQFVSVGPSCHQTLHYTNLQCAQILLRETHIDSYMQNQALKHHRHTHCRQLLSAFDHKSTYFTYRASIFSDFLLLPQTVFTIGDVPGTNYGISVQNDTRLISVFLKTIARWINSNHTITMECIIKLKEEIRKNDAVLLLVSNLETEFVKKNEALNILDFLGEQKGLSSLVQSLASNITVANKQVKENIMEYFSTTFGRK